MAGLKRIETFSAFDVQASRPKLLPRLCPPSEEGAESKRRISLPNTSEAPPTNDRRRSSPSLSLGPLLKKTALETKTETLRRVWLDKRDTKEIKRTLSNQERCRPQLVLQTPRFTPHPSTHKPRPIDHEPRPSDHKPHPDMEGGKRGHTRTTSFPDMSFLLKGQSHTLPRPKTRPLTNNTLPRPVKPHDKKPPKLTHSCNSCDETGDEESGDEGRRARRNSLSGMANAVKDKLNNVRTRVRRMSSSGGKIPLEKLIDKPPILVKRTSPEKNTAEKPPIVKRSSPEKVPSTPDLRIRRHKMASNHHDNPGEELPPQPRSRVNSFTDVVKEKFKHVQARARRRPRVPPPGGEGESPNLVIPATLVRGVSSPDISGIGLEPVQQEKVTQFTEDFNLPVTPLTVTRTIKLDDVRGTKSLEDDDADVKYEHYCDITNTEDDVDSKEESGDVGETRDVVTDVTSDIQTPSNVPSLDSYNVGYHDDIDVSDVTRDDVPQEVSLFHHEPVHEAVLAHLVPDEEILEEAVYGNHDNDYKHSHHSDLDLEPDKEEAGPYVALTLLGRPAGSSSSSRPDVTMVPPSGGSPGSPPVGDGSDRITRPQPVDDPVNKEYHTQKIALTRMMYEAAANQLESMKSERNPSEAELNDQLRTLRKLENALYQLTGIPAESHLVSTGTRSPPPGAVPTGYPVSPLPASQLPPLPPGHAPSHVSHAHFHIRSAGEEVMPAAGQGDASWLPGGPKHKKTESMPEFYDVDRQQDAPVARSQSDSRKRDSDSHKLSKERKRRSQKRHSLHSATSLPTSGMDVEHSPGVSPTTSPLPVKDGWSLEQPMSDSNEDIHDSGHLDTEGGPPIIPMMPTERLPVSPLILDAEDFTSDEDGQVDEHGPFSDLNVLKHKPAHLAVFLNYLISNSDPSPLLFYLVTEGYSQGNMKEMRKWAYEIHSTFLLPRSPLRVNVEEATVVNINNVLQMRHDKMDALQTVFGVARHIAQNEISELLADFRNKCALGLGNLYGTHEIPDDDKTQELQLVERKLGPHFIRLHEGEEGSDRNQALAWALATFLKQVGCTLSGKNSTILERCPSFVAKDKKYFGTKFKQGKRVVMKDHSFNLHNHYMYASCHHCNQALWGIGPQGLVCQYCEMNVHKPCMEQVKETCRSSAAKKPRRTSSIMSIIRNKPNNPPATPTHTKDRWSDEGYTSPGSMSATSGHARTASRDHEDEEALRQHSERERSGSSSHDNHQGGAAPEVTEVTKVRRKSKEGQSPRSPRTSVFYMSTSSVTSSTDEVDSAPFNDPILDHLRSTRPVSQILEQYGGAARSPEDLRSPGSPPRTHSPEPNNEDQERITVPVTKPPKKKHVVRSESLKSKSETVSKIVRRSRSDLHVDDPSVKATLNQSGSDTSITGSLESPSNSNELLNELSIPAKHAVSHDDSDLDIENELPPTGIPHDQVKKLKPKEKKRQDVINEFIHTERTHLRNLKVMLRVFYQPMESIVSRDLMKLLFPNLEEVNQIHSSLCKSFRERKKENPQVAELGDLLLNRFDGEPGEKMRTACALFCRNQSHALETLRLRQRKDQKLQQFLQEASTNPLCRRLELKDLLVTVMQRLTKYPLLIENLMKYTQSAIVEYERLERALQCSRDILSYVNEAVKECENHQKLVDIQRRLDKKAFENSSLPIVSEYKNLDLTRHRMIYHGPLTWRIARSKQIELHVVLLEEILVLLQKQDDKYVLKCSTTVVSGRDDAKYTHSPIIKLTNLLTRNVAVDKRAFFLVCTSDIGPQIYELHAMSKEEKNKWLRYITEGTEQYKKRKQEQGQSQDEVKVGSEPSSRPEGQQSEDVEQERKISKDEASDVEVLEQHRSSSVDSLENVGKVAVLHTNQAELIQPNEVVISDTVLEEAEPILSPKEELRRRDEKVRQALEEKQRSVAELLNVPYSQYGHIAEMASEMEGAKDTQELVLATIHQASKLTSLVNTSLSVLEEEEQENEEEAALPNTPVYGASAGKFDERKVVMVTLPSDHVLDISKKVNEQLTSLLAQIKSYEDEKQHLLAELAHTKEQLHLAQDVPARSPTSSFSRHSRPNSFASVTSSTSEIGESVEDVQTYAQNEDTAGAYLSTSPRAATVSTSAIFELQKLEIVESEPESDDANHNISQDAIQTVSCDTDANLNQTTDERNAELGEGSDQENIGTSF